VNLVEYLARATEYLEKHGISSARLNAELLLAHLLRLSRLELYTNFDRRLSTAEADAYRDLVVERGSGRPLQYITGDTGFRGMTLAVAEGVFIPRPETEVLVEKALEALDQCAAHGGSQLKVLDLGTGCGNIALSIASERDAAVVTATDLDPAACDLCARNAAAADLGERVFVAAGDLYDAVDAGATYDVIVSNPPYVPSGMLDSLPGEVKGFEPSAALFAGADGMDVIRRVVEGAPGRLVEGGYLVLEVDESHAQSVRELLDAGPWDDVAVFEDLAGRERVVRAKLGS
jgi:release factor glutamine methyltransferase